MAHLAPFTVRRIWGCGTVKIMLTVATAASGMVLAAAPGGAAAGCAPGVGGPRHSTFDGAVGKQGSWGPRVSGDGRYVAFVSYEHDLVAGDTNQDADVFRVDRATGEILRVSLDADGSELQGPAAEGSISADGTRVAFSSASAQVYVRDIGAARTIRASVNDAGAAADDWTVAPVVSPDGRFVAFTSAATNLVPSDRSRGSIEAYLRDLEAGTTERVSIGGGGLAAPTWSWAGAVSEGGRFVAFTAGAAGGSLTPDDTYPGSDVFVRDRQALTTEVISIGPDGRSMGGWFLGMSADGMRILFGSGPHGDSKPAVFVRDRAARTTRFLAPLVTTWRHTPTTRMTAGSTAELSADGHVAAIQTALPTGPDDTNAADDIVLVDLATGDSRPATRSSSGCQGNGASGDPTLSRDGSTVGFTSEADDLVGSNNHRITNVYLREMIAQRTERMSTAPSTAGG
jgi:Tol biopolymer transport system component